jgi:hypothetical protein
MGSTPVGATKSILAGCFRGRKVRAVNPVTNSPPWVRIPPCQPTRCHIALVKCEMDYGRYPSGYRDQSDKLGKKLRRGFKSLPTDTFPVSSVVLERSPVKRRVGGSNPPRGARNSDLKSYFAILLRKIKQKQHSSKIFFP